MSPALHLFFWILLAPLMTLRSSFGTSFARLAPQPKPEPQETTQAPDPYLRFKPETNPAKQPSTVYRGRAYEREMPHYPLNPPQFKDHQTPVQIPQITAPPPVLYAPR